MGLKNVAIAFLILTPLIFGYLLIEKAARDGIADHEATQRYLADNTSPKPIKINVVGCIRGKEEPSKFGKIEILGTQIRVPCYRTPMVRDLIGKKFLISWNDNTILESTKRKIAYSLIFTHHVVPITRNGKSDLTKPTEIKGARFVGLIAPEVFGNKVFRMYCYQGALGCRGYVIFSKNVLLILDIDESSIINISDEELQEIVSYVISTTKVFY